MQHEFARQFDAVKNPDGRQRGLDACLQDLREPGVHRMLFASEKAARNLVVHELLGQERINGYGRIRLCANRSVSQRWNEPHRPGAGTRFGLRSRPPMLFRRRWGCGIKSRQLVPGFRDFIEARCVAPAVGMVLFCQRQIRPPDLLFIGRTTHAEHAVRVHLVTMIV